MLGKAHIPFPSKLARHAAIPRWSKKIVSRTKTNQKRNQKIEETFFLREASLMADRIASSNSLNYAYRAPAVTRSTSLLVPRSSSFSPKCHLSSRSVHLSASRSFVSPLSNRSMTGACKVLFLFYGGQRLIEIGDRVNFVLALQ